jgi:hypothetical protein
MADYLIRNIDPDIWARFKARSEHEGVPMRVLLLLLIEAYADKKISVSARKS